MMKYSIITLSSVERGKPDLLSSDLKSHTCMQCEELSIPREHAFSWRPGKTEA